MENRSQRGSPKPPCPDKPKDEATSPEDQIADLIDGMDFDDPMPLFAQDSVTPSTATALDVPSGGLSAKTIERAEMELDALPRRALHMLAAMAVAVRGQRLPRVLQSAIDARAPAKVVCNALSSAELDALGHLRRHFDGGLGHVASLAALGIDGDTLQACAMLESLLMLSETSS